MIIKSHIRGGYRSAAEYLKDIGKNEEMRLVQISDPDAKNLDQAFHNMWAVASTTKATKPLHHISINPYKDERLTDKQVQRIIARCEAKYGYEPHNHQRVVVEHIKDGRQHFHVMWNRVNLKTGKVTWPGHHWKKSKQVAREMEQELGLKRPVPRRSRGLQTKPHHLSTSSHAHLLSKEKARRPSPTGQHRYASLRQQISVQEPIPLHPNQASTGMCEAQRIDFMAACEGKITWRQYFKIWGRNLG